MGKLPLRRVLSAVGEEAVGFGEVQRLDVRQLERGLRFMLRHRGEYDGVRVGVAVGRRFLLPLLLHGPGDGGVVSGGRGLAAMRRLSFRMAARSRTIKEYSSTSWADMVGKRVGKRWFFLIWGMSSRRHMRNRG